MILEKILLTILTVAGIGFFEGMETALLSSSIASFSKLEERYPEKSAYFRLWEERPHHLLAAIVVGTNAFFTASAVLAASISIDLLEISGFSSAGVLFPFVVTGLVLVFGEILPKVYGRKYPEKACVSGIRYLSWFASAAAPLTRVLLNFSKTAFGLFGFRAHAEPPFMTKEELKLVLKAEKRTPAADMLSSVLSFGERKIREIMMPRSNIFAVDYGAGLEKIIHQAISSHYSRVPVFRNSLDNITGLIYIRDLLVARSDSTLYVVDDLLRPVLFVPENAPISGVLGEFKTGKHHLAIVVDEYGVTKGLVTAEDIVEEIVGEIYDESDIGEKTIIELPDSWLIKGGESIAAVNRELRLNIPAGDSYSTIAGWALVLFGRIPSAGEQTRWNDIKIEIAEADEKKVHSVKIKKRQSSPLTTKP